MGGEKEEGGRHRDARRRLAKLGPPPRPNLVRRCAASAFIGALRWLAQWQLQPPLPLRHGTW
jgi:hypothetical protein